MSQAKHRTYSLLSNQRQSSGACKRPSRWLTRAAGSASLRKSSSSCQTLAAAQKQRGTEQRWWERGTEVRQLYLFSILHTYTCSPSQCLEYELLITHTGGCLAAEAQSPAMNHRRNRRSCWWNRLSSETDDILPNRQSAVNFSTQQYGYNSDVTVKQTTLPSQTKSSHSLAYFLLYTTYIMNKEHIQITVWP